jgi:hypothetical protein
MENAINDDDFFDLVEYLEFLPEYRRKQIAALLIHSTLNPIASELVADRAKMWIRIDKHIENQELQTGEN